MKKLNNLDKIIIELTLEDFAEGKVDVNEVKEVIRGYEENKFDVAKYNLELKEVIAKKYVADQFLTKYRENENT